MNTSGAGNSHDEHSAANRQELRAWLQPDGLRVCRDVDGQPQHLEYISDAYGGTLIWENHEEGARVPVVEALSAEAV